MKPYKTSAMNKEVRRVVHHYKTCCPHHNGKYLTNDEFACDVSHLCNTTYAVAVKATWIIRADGSRDIEALRLFGFNQHTA